MVILKSILPSLLTVLVLGCNFLGDPDAIGSTVLIAGSESGDLIQVDPATGRVVRRLAGLPRYQDAHVLSSDSTTLYLTGGDERIPRELVSVNAHTLGIRWRERLSNGVDLRLDRFAGLAVYGDYSLALTEDGSRLFAASASRGDQRGIAVLDSRTRDVLGFLAPLDVVPSGLSIGPRRAPRQNGVIMALARRDRFSASSNDWLFFIDDATLQIFDSISVSSTAGGLPLRLQQAVVAPDGEAIYILASGYLLGISTVSLEVFASRSVTARGHLALSNDGSRLYLADRGGKLDLPGSGKVMIYDNLLQGVDSIDLRTSAEEAPVARYAAIDTGNSILYVTSGTPSRGPLYGPQPAKLLIVDVFLRKVRSAVSLGDWNPGPVYVQ